jgi:hypothetical protein
MRRVIPKSAFDFLTEEERSSLAAWIASLRRRTDATAALLRSIGILTERQALQILYVLAVETDRDLEVEHRHRCSDRAFIERRPFHAGPPELPVRCRRCGMKVTSSDEIVGSFVVEVPTRLEIGES